MGLRGPLRDPNSRRGRAEAAKAARIAAADASKAPRPSIDQPEEVRTGDYPTCPTWMSEGQQILFRSLVRDLQSACVPVKHIDTHAIMMAVQCLSGVREADGLSQDPELETSGRLAALRLKAQLGKDLIQWLQLICATPAARARIGIKGGPEKKGGRLAELLAMKQGRQ